MGTPTRVPREKQRHLVEQVAERGEQSQKNTPTRTIAFLCSFLPLKKMSMFGFFCIKVFNVLRITRITNRVFIIGENEARREKRYRSKLRRKSRFSYGRNIVFLVQVVRIILRIFLWRSMYDVGISFL